MSSDDTSTSQRPRVIPLFTEKAEPPTSGDVEDTIAHLARCYRFAEPYDKDTQGYYEIRGMLIALLWARGELSSTYVPDEDLSDWEEDNESSEEIAGMQLADLNTFRARVIQWSQR